MTVQPKTIGGDTDSDEQSIESVLHSIRRILKEDQPARDDVANDIDTDRDPDGDTLMLDRSMLVAPDEPASDPSPLSRPDHSLLAIAQRAQERERPPAPGRPETNPEPASSSAPTSSASAAQPEPPTMGVDAPDDLPKQQIPDDRLIGDETRAAAERSLDALHEALSRHERRTTITGMTPVSVGSITIEDMVRQEVRAMVRTWLDAHLPSLVEIMVRAEISKMAQR